MKRSLFHVACWLGLACGDAGSESTLDPAGYAEGRVPLPDCPGFDYSRCDIEDPECVNTLASIAHCLRGELSAFVAPAVLLQSEAEFFDSLFADASAEPPPNPNHFENALVQFGLAEPRSFDPMSVAMRYSTEVAAYYDTDTKEIIIIQRAEGDEEEEEWRALDRPRLLLHELVHALQDQAHDLVTFGDLYYGSRDGFLRGASVVEGEARLHDRRYFAALTGLDIDQVDLERSFDNLALYMEQWLFDQADHYALSPLSVPYGPGSRFVYEVWKQGGPGAVRGLFDAPPHSMQEVLAAAWQGSSEIEIVEPVGPELPGATSVAWTTLGAWGVYLLVEPLLVERDEARTLALAWRGDRFEAFANEVGETLARWEVALADATQAQRLAAVLEGHPTLTATQTGSSVVLTPR